jgi:hypothetical protein
MSGVPFGVRVMSAMLWLAATCGTFLVIAGFVADRHVAGAIPSFAPYTAVVGGDPSYLVSTVRDALWLQIAFSAVAVAGCVVDAVWVRRPTGNSRIAGLGLPIVLIPVMGILLGGSATVEADTLADATGVPGLVEAYHRLLPSWLGLGTQIAEIGVIVGLATSLVFVLRGRYDDYYQRGRVEESATFWATEKLKND